jgi:DNA topoisomerase-3
VRQALSAMQPNAGFRGLYEAALGRQRADWLFGINLTRLYTVLGRAGGYDGVLSVGRVQTPLLGLVVRRDIEIDTFQPKTYWVLTVSVQCAAGPLTALWTGSEEGTPPGVDATRRLVSRERALAIKARVEGQRGTVLRCTCEKKSEAPPLPYSLPDLQVHAGKRLGLTPKQTLDACQALYEAHRLVTYPRSDCRYLPVGHNDQARAVLGAVATNAPGLAYAVSGAELSRKSRAWNDKKVTAHHAIIPTSVCAPNAQLSVAERKVYELVASRYLAQFLPAFEFTETRIEIEVTGERFRASGRQPIAEGWRNLVSVPPAQEIDSDDEVDDIRRERPFPVLHDGDGVVCTAVSLSEKQTTPPKRFTDASLIEAMTGIARFVDDQKIKQLLRETDGIGTPATQADIIETLFERRFIERQRRHIISTAIGRALVATLPEVTTRPDMSALWEAAMRRISDSQLTLPTFLEAVTTQLRELIDRGRAAGALRVPGARPCAAPGCSGYLRRRKGPHGIFWSCSRYPECKQTAADERTAPGPKGRPAAARRPRSARRRQPESNS